MIEKIQFYRSLKLFCLSTLISGTLIFMISHKSYSQEFLIDPPCETTTCISADTIAIAKNTGFAHAEFDLVVMNVLLLLPEPIVPCLDPRQTGVVVHRQIPKEIELFFDGFCTNQGCVPTTFGDSCQ